MFELFLDLALEILDGGIVDLMRLLSVVSDVHDFSLFALSLWSGFRFLCFWFFVEDHWIGFLILVVGSCNVVVEFHEFF